MLLAPDRTQSHWTVLVCVLESLSSSAAYAQSGKLSKEKRARIEQAVAKTLVNSRAPGIAVAVVEDGEFQWSKGFGMAGLEKSVPVTPADPLPSGLCIQADHCGGSAGAELAWWY